MFNMGKEEAKKKVADEGTVVTMRGGGVKYMCGD